MYGKDKKRKGMMYGGMGKKKMMHGGESKMDMDSAKRKKMAMGGPSQPSYGHGEMPKGSAN